MQPAVYELVSSLIGEVRTEQYINMAKPPMVRAIVRPTKPAAPIPRLVEGIAEIPLPEPKRSATKGRRRSITLKDLPTEQLELLTAQARCKLVQRVHDYLVLKLAVRKLCEMSDNDPLRIARSVISKLFSENGLAADYDGVSPTMLPPDKWTTVRERLSDYDPAKIILTRELVNELVVEETVPDAKGILKEIDRLTGQLGQALGKRVLVSYSVEPSMGRMMMHPVLGGFIAPVPGF